MAKQFIQKLMIKTKTSSEDYDDGNFLHLQKQQRIQEKQKTLTLIKNKDLITRTMETGVYQVELKDGRIFRIVFVNSTQARKIIDTYNQIKEKVEKIKVITNGLHTAKQWQEIVKTL